MNHARALAILALVTSSLAGCRDVDRFDPGPEGAYCGAMVSAPVFHEGFIRDGAPPVLRLRLELDVDNLTTRPGSLTTDDAARGLCREMGQPLFDAAPLRAIPEVMHDPLALLEFGEGHDHNVFAYVDSTCQGTLLALVSLMRNDDIEVRLFKPAPTPQEDAGAAERPGFALFPLERRDREDCGF